MLRRTFIKNTGKMAIAIGVFGSIEWKNNRYIGDTPTTTDILGPFYRPNAPLRTNILPPDFSGDLLHLSGTIFKEDGKTPFKNCLIEIWQCAPDELYDNTSDDYWYRGSQKTDHQGKYHFVTTQPVPYPMEEDPSIYRPAHIHLHLSGDGVQDLITQIYFKGDPYIKEDSAASSPTSQSRILNITRNNKNENELRFDVVMAKEFKPDDNVFKKVAGLYKMNDESSMEFFREGDLLFMKWNGQIREGLSYESKNQFSGGANSTTTASFELLPLQKVNVKVHFIAQARRKEFNLSGVRTLKY